MKTKNHPTVLPANKPLPGLLAAFLTLIFLFHTSAVPAQGQFHLAEMGDYTLENGQVIRDCKIGYRTFGQLNAEQSNAILFPTWYGGTNESLIPYIGPDQMLDSTKYFVIIVDAFGDGISSSPSNSAAQPGRLFPEFSIRDMVNAQHKLLTEKLGITHLYAVTGISMGGMQTFQWMASYPDFFDNAAPIVGSPTLTSHDRLLFELFVSILEQCGEDDCPEAATTALMLEYIVGFTPAYRQAETPPQAFPDLAAAIREEAGNYRSYDLLSQMRAISRHDITAGFDGSLDAIAERFKGQVFITVAGKDQMLLPTPSKALAEEMQAGLLELESDCGHYAFACDKERIGEAVRLFLNKSG